MAKDQIEDFNVDDGDEKDLDQFGVWVSADTPDEAVDNSDGAIMDLDESKEEVDDLGDLNDLLMSIDEDGDQDDTLYLEEDELSLDLDAETSDFIADQGSSGGSDFDGLDGLDIPSIDDELSLDDDDDFVIPELDDTLQSSVNDLANLDDEDNLGLDEPVNQDEEIVLAQDEDYALHSNLDLEEDNDLEMEVLDTEGVTELAEENKDLALDSPIVDEEVLDFTMDTEDLDLPEMEITESSFEDDNSEFDDVGAVTEEMFGNEEAEITIDEDVADMSNMQNQITEMPAAQTPAVEAQGASVLLSIEKELHAIRSELMDLRSELVRLRSKSPADTIAPNQEEESTVESSEEFVADAPKGFFEDDEDETIALTGDELDNILNSADFTEEAGQPSEIEDDSILGMSSVDAEINPDSTADEIVLPYEESASDLSPPIEEIVLEEIQDIDSSLADISESTSSEAVNDEDHLDLDESAELFERDEAEIENMANLDIEKELQGIEDLSDSESDIELFTDTDLSEIEIDVPETPEVDMSMVLEEESANDEFVEPTPSIVPLTSDMPYNIKQEIKAVLQYMDQLLDALPQEKIEDFAKSEHFETYKKLFEELGI